MENLYRETKACVDVNGSLTDVFDNRVGVRQGDNLSPLLFIIFMNDFLEYVSSKFTGISLDYDEMHMKVFLKLFVLLYADDTLLFSKNAEDVQNAINSTLSYCEVNNMCINTGKTKYMIFSRGKVRKHHAITAHGQAIERVVTFCYLGIVFRYNNTFQAPMKHNINKAKKALFKIDIRLSKVELQVRTRLHLFDSLILQILLYGCELWGYENIEQIEVFHRNVLRRMLELRKSAPKTMMYGKWVAMKLN